MKKKILTSDDFVDIAEYEDDRYPIQFFIGSRGDGKTFSGEGLAVYEAQDTVGKARLFDKMCELFPRRKLVCGREPERFIWMRRTEKELKALMDNRVTGEAGNPFKTLNTELGTSYGICGMGEGMAGIYHRVFTDKGIPVPEGEPIGYGLALNTMAGIRSTDFSDATRVFYDEFIPERHVRRMKDEGGAFLNALESIGRNREMLGEPPLKVYCFANSYNIYTPILQSVGLINRIERMLVRGETDAYLPERCCAIHLLAPREKFLEAKQNTSLYKFAQGTEFANMALNNEFVYNDFSNISYRNVSGYRPLCSCEHMYIYAQKGGRGLYCTYTPARVPHYKTHIPVDRMSWARKYRVLCKDRLISGMVVFETFELKEMFLDLLDIKTL